MPTSPTAYYRKRVGGLRSFVVILVYTLLCACGQEAIEEQHNRHTPEQARKLVEGVKRINEREIRAAERSGDSESIAQAKVRATQRLAEAERKVGDALVEQTKEDAASKRRPTRSGATK